MILYDITERKRSEETLKTQMIELDRFNRAMIGREVQRIELKQEINELCQTVGLPVRHQEHKAGDLAGNTSAGAGLALRTGGIK